MVMKRSDSCYGLCRSTLNVTTGWLGYWWGGDRWVVVTAHISIYVLEVGGINAP